MKVNVYVAFVQIELLTERLMLCAFFVYQNQLKFMIDVIVRGLRVLGIWNRCLEKLFKLVWGYEFEHSMATTKRLSLDIICSLLAGLAFIISTHLILTVQVWLQPIIEFPVFNTQSCSLLIKEQTTRMSKQSKNPNSSSWF